MARNGMVFLLAIAASLAAASGRGLLETSPEPNPTATSPAACVCTCPNSPAPVVPSPAPAVPSPEPVIASPAPASPTPTISITTINVYGQCGGQAGNCVTFSATLGRPIKDVCRNADFPDSACAPGSYCRIHTLFYRQCVPGNKKLRLPLDGSYVVKANSELKEVAEETWDEISAAGGTKLPDDAGCNSNAPAFEPITGGHAIANDKDWILTFEVSFANCDIFTTVDANVIKPAEEGAPVSLVSYRVAPYTSSNTFKQCDANGVCIEAAVFQMWEQCGGTLGEISEDAVWATWESKPVQCAYGTNCVREHKDYYQCKPV